MLLGQCTREHMKNENRSDQLESPSYMEIRLDLEGRQGAVFLRIPTFWDAVNSQWIGAIKLKNGKILCSEGKNSFDLQNNFNIIISKVLQDPEFSEEIFSMFKALEYWESRNMDGK